MSIVEAISTRVGRSHAPTPLLLHPPGLAARELLRVQLIHTVVVREVDGGVGGVGARGGRRGGSRGDGAPRS